MSFKKEICKKKPAFAYYSAFGGLEFHAFKHEDEDYAYCVSGAWTGNPSYHRLRIQYDNNGSYVKLKGVKVPFSECIKMGL